MQIHPNKTPKFIWITLSSENKWFFNIYRKLKETLILKGFILESRPLMLHITLGRIKKRLPENLIYKFLTTELIHKSITIEKATLFKSVLHSTGPIYEDLVVFKI